ncbi:hypothetical protein RGQ15_17745 [Paracoccus sp. MBLB3053]|uniref:Uncharacterized protein n=1 Tax=Paracoccus aurantius TaxID=3073814 RepID=A0ABU2HY17_9RHOB|nr:hypothetical protein [Paracoccus sp. MBLB3053]MDS9469410.1 hypothetical protein [Paracoccus sp. MBLB3053]
MFEQTAQTDTSPKIVQQTGAHRCLACLQGDNGKKRACAFRHMLAAGYSVKAIEDMRSSAKRTQ